MSDFVHLHCHSQFSLMDGLNSPEELCDAAKDLGQTAIAVTDHGTLSGHRELQRACRDRNMKPILGLEAYMSATDRFDRRKISAREDNTQVFNHLVLIAKNTEGLDNLNTLSRLAWTEGFYHKPRIDAELLEEYRNGIIVLSGCLNGLIAKAIENEDDTTARYWMRWFKNTFEDDFYVELQGHNPEHINHGLIGYANTFNANLIATSDCHFARAEERPLEEILLTLSTNPKVNKSEDYNSTKHLTDIFERLEALYEDRPISFKDLDVYVNDRTDVQGAMEKQEIFRTDLYDNTLAVLDKIDTYPLHEDLELMPTPKLKWGQTKDEELRIRAFDGLKDRGKDKNDNYKERLEEELSVIESMKFSDYFLVVADLVQFAHDQGIIVGPGRGSAVGSLLTYCLGITNIDPIEYGLLFFRFLNPDRNEMPDIDIDFQKSRRDEIKQYLIDTYENVASISTFTYFSEKGVIRDASRVLSVPLGDVNRALKKVDTFEEFEESSVEDVAQFRKNYPEALEYARKLRGRIRNVGMHAAGVVVSKEPIEHFAPIESRSDPKNKVSGRIPVVAQDMHECERIGLLKLDLLGLTMLDVIGDALTSVKKNHGVAMGMLDIPLDDDEVYKALSKGRTVGVFQADASAYTNLLKEMQVSSFEELAASNALVRPGARDTVGESFIKRKKGKEPVKYVHEKMEPFLSETYGVIIYQEQVMQAAVELGGLSMVDADKMRKIIGKKKDPKLFEQFKDAFVKGAQRYISKKQAEGLWENFEKHAGYSFNKSHAVAYSLLTYVTMWLKLHYPLEFMTALLRNEEDRDKQTEYLIEAKKMGLRVLLPHVNKSDKEFSIDGDAIRFGLNNIKYISDKISEKLMRERPFESYDQLVEAAEMKHSGINTRTIQALNAVGAAEFPENPLTGNEHQNYYEYLGIPKFDSYEFGNEVNDLLTYVDDFDETKTVILKGMVKSIKKGKGWSRIEVLDETGSCGIFHQEDTSIEPGQLYFILAANNRIHRFVPVDKVYNANKNSDDPFIKFLKNENVSDPQSKYVICFNKRKTKAGKMMGNVIVANDKREIRDLLVFPNTFRKVYGRIKEGTQIKPSIKRLQDGGLTLTEIN